MDREEYDELLEECYECRGYGDDEILINNELESRCPYCYVRRRLNEYRF